MGQKLLKKNTKFTVSDAICILGLNLEQKNGLNVVFNVCCNESLNHGLVLHRYGIFSQLDEKPADLRDSSKASQGSLF